MKEYFCWKCDQKMPFLNEEEWAAVSPLLGNAIGEIKEYRRLHRVDLKTAIANVKPAATEMFRKLTGMPNVHFDVIYHHRLSDWGPECSECKFLLRTNKASHCVNCGADRST